MILDERVAVPAPEVTRIVRMSNKDMGWYQVKGVAVPAPEVKLIVRMNNKDMGWYQVKG